MARRSGLAAVTASLLAFLATPSPAAPGGTPIGSGARVAGNVDSATDRDGFLIEAPEGARLAVTVKGAGRAPLLPSLEVARPDGTSMNLATALVGESTTLVSLAGLSIPSTGVHTVTVKGFQGATGDYAATFQVLVDAKTAQSLVVPAGGTATVEFAAWEGTTVSFSAKEIAGPALPGARLLDPDGTAVEGSEAARKGSALAAKGVRLASGSGLYALALDGSATGETTVILKASFKSPKRKAMKLKLGAEPRIAALAPPTGRDGTAFALSGTAFAEGCRVYFDGAYEATEVARGGDGSLTGKAPACPTAQSGGDVAVTVVNPDGQTGTLERAFRYHGLPLPQYATPPASPLAGGTLVTVTGSGFRPGASVLFGGTPATDVAILSGGKLACVTPAHASGPVSVRVVDEFGRAGTLPAEFQYADPPSVTAADPASAPSFGGRTVTLAGSEFIPGDRVFVGGVEAGGVQVASRTSLSFVLPATDAGTPGIEVRDPLGRSWTGSGLLTLTDSFHDVTATSVPAPPAGAAFPGATLAIGDFTGDGAPDLVTASAAPRVNTVTGLKDPAAQIFVNDGKGGFSDGIFTTLPSFRETGDFGQADALAAGDLDGDGIAEVLATRAKVLNARDAAGSWYGYPATYHMGDSPDADWATISSTRLWASSGSGPLQDVTEDRVAPTGSTPAEGKGDRWQGAASALGDLDGDGSLDLLVVAKDTVVLGFPQSEEWTYERRGSYYYGYYYVPVSVSISEATTAKGCARIALSDGAGGLAWPAGTPGPVIGGAGVVLDDFRGVACAAADLDGDGVAEAILLSDAPTMTVAGDGSIVPAPALRVLTGDGWGGIRFARGAVPDGDAASGDFWQGAAVAAGDLDGDGDNDLVVGRAAVSYWTDGAGAHLLPAIRVFRNDGAGSFTEDTAGFFDRGLFDAPSAATLLGVRSLALADVDGDGSLDLALTSRETTVPDSGNGKGPQGLLPAGRRSATRLLLNDGNGRLADATADRIPLPVAGDLLAGDAVALRDLDGDGRPDLVVALDVAPAEGRSPVRVLLTR